MQRIELLAPAGDLEKLKIAIEYGADAVYFVVRCSALELELVASPRKT